MHNFYLFVERYTKYKKHYLCSVKYVTNLCYICYKK
jgi:hypothetical protein